MKQQGKKYTDEEVTAIIENISDQLCEGLSLRKICQSDGMPAKSTILRWLNNPHDKTLATTIARAREMQADALDDEMAELVARMLQGEIGHNETRVAIWAAQWRASKLRPKRYGDKVLNEVSGPEGTPLTLITSTTDPETAARFYREMIER